MRFTRLAAVAAAIFFCSPVFAQQHADCPRGTGTACTTTAPTSTTAMDPLWLVGGKFNSNFDQLYGMFGVTGILYGNGAVPNALTAATGAQILAAMGLSGVAAGSYTNANITVDQYGRVTAAANGTGGGGSMTWPAAPGIPCYSGSSTWCTSYSASNPMPANFLPSTLLGGISISAPASGTALTINGGPSSHYAEQILASSTQNAQGIGLNLEQELNHPGAASWDDFGQATEAFTPSSDSQNFTGQISAVYGSLDHFGSGSLSAGYGGNFEAFNQGPSTNVTVLAGVSATANNGGPAAGNPVQTPANTGSVADAIAIQGQVLNWSSGNITSAQGIHIYPPSVTGTGNILNDYGLVIEDQTKGTTSNFAIQTGKGLVHFGDVMQVASYTVSTLPACTAANKGGIVYVTDATTPVYNGTLVGGGATVTRAFCNGTNWVGIAGTTIPTSALPALAGDVTSTAGSNSVTVSKVNGASLPASAGLLGTNASSQIIAAPASGVTAGSYTNANITVNAQGQVTAASNGTAGGGTVTTTGTPASGNIAAFSGATSITNATASQVLSLLNSQTCNAQTGTTYTFVLGDANNCVTMANAAANTVTVPANSSVAFPVGTTLTVVQTGAGATTLEGAGSPVTLESARYGSSTTQTYPFSSEYSCLSVQKVATDTWFVSACDYSGGASGNAVITDPSATQTITAGSATVTPLTLKGATSQSADLLDLENSTGTNVLGMNSSGSTLTLTASNESFDLEPGYNVLLYPGYGFYVQSNQSFIAAGNDANDSSGFGVGSIPNDTTTGTTRFTLTKLTGGSAIIAATSDTSGIIGITDGNAGKAGNPDIILSGLALCIFDGATTAGDYVQISSTIGGDCHDAGATRPASNEIIGRVLSTNAAAGTYAVLMELENE